MFWISDFHLVYSHFYITSPCPILFLSLLLMAKMLVHLPIWDVSAEPHIRRAEHM